MSIGRQAWHQSWRDLVASLRGDSPEGEPPSSSDRVLESATDCTSEVPNGPASDADHGPPDEIIGYSERDNLPLAIEARPDNSEQPSHEGVFLPASSDEKAQRKADRQLPKTYLGVLIGGTALVLPWLLSPYHFDGHWFDPEAPAENVIASFDGGQITLEDVEDHLALLVPEQLRDLARTPDGFLEVVEDMITDRLVLRWAVERKPEGEETFRHAMKHINERLRLDAFADRLHDGAIPVRESEIRTYYDANKAKYADRTFADARGEIQEFLIAEREPRFIDDYIGTLKDNASISRNFELLAVPPPSDDEFQRYYKNNLAEFQLPRQAVLDQIEIPIEGDGVSSRQAAIDMLLKIRSGSSLEEAAKNYPTARVSKNLTVSKGVRSRNWDTNVFSLDEGEISSAFRTETSFYLVRLSTLKEPRTRKLDEVREQINADLLKKVQAEWFARNADKTLFTIKGQRYTVGQFYAEYEELPALIRGEFAGPEGLERLANSLIDRMLLVTDTYNQLLDVATKPFADESRLQILRQMMEQEEVDDKIEVTEEELKAYYTENSDRMVTPPKARIRYIRIGRGSTADEDRQARRKAEEAYDKLVPGYFGTAEPFDRVAREYSEDPETAARGGELDGWVGESMDPWAELTQHPLHEVALSIPVGEISEPFDVGDSLYIISIIERAEPEMVEFDLVKPLIEERLTSEKHRTLATRLHQRLREEADIVVYTKVLESYLKQLSRPASRTADLN